MGGEELYATEVYWCDSGWDWAHCFQCDAAFRLMFSHWESQGYTLKWHSQIKTTPNRPGVERHTDACEGCAREGKEGQGLFNCGEENLTHWALPAMEMDAVSPDAEKPGCFLPSHGLSTLHVALLAAFKCSSVVFSASSQARALGRLQSSITIPFSERGISWMAKR